MTTFTFTTGRVDDEGNVTLPELGTEAIRSWNEYRLRFGDPDDDDELFDAAYDFVLNDKEHGPFAELRKTFGDDDEGFWNNESEATEIAREWCYALMEAIGRPYGGE